MILFKIRVRRKTQRESFYELSEDVIAESGKKFSVLQSQAISYANWKYSLSSEGQKGMRITCSEIL